MKKILALLLSLSLVVSNSMIIFADEVSVSDNNISDETEDISESNKFDEFLFVTEEMGQSDDVDDAE